jgi:hypothetical protein
MAEEVGVGYVRLLPSMRGFGAAASKELGSALTGPAKSAGQDAGSNFTSGVGSGIDKDKGKISGFGSKMGDLFKGALAAGGVAAGAALVVGLMSSLDTEVAEDRLAAQLGGGAWAEGMGEVAGNLYIDAFGDSVADTAGAVKTTLQSGLLPEGATNAQVESMTEKVLTFSDVLEQDLPMATQAASNMIRSGLAKDGGEALDVLTAGIQAGADRAGDLAETFQEYSTIFRDIGLSGQQATGLLSQGLQAGARDADTVADALKEFAIRGQDASEASAAGFAAIGLNAEEMTAKVAAGGPAASEALGQVLDGLRGIEDPVARNAAAVALFGTKAEDLGDSLFALDLDTAAAELGDVAGATDELGSAYDNNATKIESFRRQALEKLSSFIGEKVIPAVEGISAWAKENPAAFKAIAAVIGGVLVVAFAAWAVSAASAAVATIAATWPILAVGAAVAGIAALVVIHWDTIAAAFRGGAEAIVGFVGGVINWVKTNWPLLLAILTGPIGIAVLIISRHWDTIKAGVTAAKDWVVGAWDSVVGFVTGLPGRIATAASGMWDSIKEGFRSAINRIIGWWNGLSLTIGGGTYDPLGAFGPAISVPSFTLSTPDIGLRLGQGGIVSHRPGGHIANIAEGGEDEVVSPISKLQKMLDRSTIDAVAAAGGQAGPGAPTVLVVAPGGDRLFTAWIQNLVRTQGGGNVQTALGQARR